MDFANLLHKGHDRKRLICSFPVFLMCIWLCTITSHLVVLAEENLCLMKIRLVEIAALLISWAVLPLTSTVWVFSSLVMINEASRKFSEGNSCLWTKENLQNIFGLFTIFFWSAYSFTKLSCVKNKSVLMHVNVSF